eukprot:TRINITY_DN2521_c0_g1_i1.p1 TRINITY_DN2521_c0_g1~~TRINITY_DN2521_c0_g1_i1.p1  ORF type:complete len:508 (+),score=56.55 TRINITY_DN2521_c0_g1_i1:88-1524(+)
MDALDRDTSGKPHSEDDTESTRSRDSSVHDCSVAPSQMLQKCTGLISIDGLHYPSFWRQDEVIQLRNNWRARRGDVFVVTHFPIMGMQRLLVALVEGHDNPWQAGLIQKPHACDFAASRRGASAFIDEAASWQHRRFFKTHAKPNDFPCQYPFQESSGDGHGPPPKVVVLVADPRHAIVMQWRAIFERFCSIWKDSKCRMPSLAQFIKMISTGQLNMLGIGNHFEHCMVWAEEASLNPDTVRIFDAGRLGSLNPREVKEELEDIAEFLEIPRERASELVAATFRRPKDADDAILQDQCVFKSALNGGHLVELSAPNVYTFEEEMSSSTSQVHVLWRDLLDSWTHSSSSRLAELARICLQGMAAAPRLSLTIPLKGDALHESGQCRPCVFALRGVCNYTADMCRFCHSPGHSKTKRASLKVRQRRRKAQEREQIRTPSRSPSPTRFATALPRSSSPTRFGTVLPNQLVMALLPHQLMVW